MGNVPVQRVEGQRRAVLRLRQDPSLRYQSELDQSLEPVADPEDQAVPFLQKALHRFLHPVISKCRGKKLRGAVRLISC